MQADAACASSALELKVVAVVGFFIVVSGGMPPLNVSYLVLFEANGCAFRPDSM